MNEIPDIKRLTIFRVDYRYRITRRTPNERWKKRYKWRDDSRIVRCASEQDVRAILVDYIKSRFTRNEYDVKITHIFPVK